jgi:Cu+-exporting ATPase
LNLLLSLPVLFYSAKDFFVSAYTGLRQRWLNIDAPIALAIAVTFLRSLYEITTHSGAGYLDSMSGIVFFMLIGRWFQDKSYDSFSFERDYTSFFPLGVTVITPEGEVNKPLSELKKGERVLVRSEEMIPADGIVLTEGALMDYSFVSGENAPIEIPKTSLVYAGGVQKGKSIEVEVVKTLGQSYITELWNNPILSNQKNEVKSFVHPWSQKFTIILFAIAMGAGIYWWMMDPNKILPAVTSVLIVACPCSLLLTVTFTYGNVLRYLGKSKMYCKNASVIEALEKIDTIVFDKTGTLTNHHEASLAFHANAHSLTQSEMDMIYAVTRESLHPLSQLIMRHLEPSKQEVVLVDSIENIPGKGTKAFIGNTQVLIGSLKLMNDFHVAMESRSENGVHFAINGIYKGYFKIKHQYREGIGSMVASLQKNGYQIHLLSGDHPTEAATLQQMLGDKVPMLFEQHPDDKLRYIQQLQSDGHKVMMVGDGLNDAGALQKSDMGVAVTDQSHLFTPASDAIIEGAQLPIFNTLLAYGKKAKSIIVFIFIISIVYNIVGMYFATQALLSPMVAAILMPISSISIVALSSFLSYWFSRKL